MTIQRVALRCPECGAAYDVPAAWAPGGQPRGLSCSHCLLERRKLVPLVRADRPEEVKA
jgi:hypothetical protein